MLYNDNPFKILDVSPTDSRREIVRKAEERALLYDSQKCTEARTILTNPQRRIAAEVHWFLDCSSDEILEIDSFISDELSGNNSEGFPWDMCCPLTQLNIQLACIDAQRFQNIAKAKFYILGISRLFEAIDSEQVLELINENRDKAGFPEISKIQDIDVALSEIRSEIRQLLSQRLQKLPEEEYTKLVTALSESYSGNQRYKGNAVLEDVISEFQIYINDTLSKQGQKIIRTAKFIAQAADKINVEQAVADLIDSLYAWDRLAQPLQLGALTKGTTHEESKEMLIALRELAIKLHNNYGLSSESLAITKATQEVFKELPEYADTLSEDNETLTRLIEEKDEEDNYAPIFAGFDEIEAIAEMLKTAPVKDRNETITKLLEKMASINNLINTDVADAELKQKMRLNLAYIVRGAGIELHNTNHDSQNALKVITAVKKAFSDIPDINTKLDEDILALKKQINYQNVGKYKQEEKNNGCLISILAIFVLFIIIMIVSSVTGTSNTSSKTTPSSKPSSSISSTPKPTATLTPQSMPASGKVFYSSTTDKPSSFKVTNNGSSNYYMKFVKAGTNTKVITFFVRANSTVEIDMPAGNLELRYAYGSTWYGEKYLFGEETRYAKDEEYYDFTNYNWEISLYTTLNTGQSMDVEYIGANDF